MYCVHGHVGNDVKEHFIRVVLQNGYRFITRLVTMREKKKVKTYHISNGTKKYVKGDIVGNHKQKHKQKKG